MHSRNMVMSEQIKKLIRDGGPKDDAEFLACLAKILKGSGFKHADLVKKSGFDRLDILPMATEDTFKQEIEDDSGEQVFLTSGTTRKNRGMRRVHDYDLYRVSVKQGFKQFCMYWPTSTEFISIVPSAAVRPDSSLSHMASIIAGIFENQAFFREKPDVIDHKGLQNALKQAIGPVFIFATQADINAVIAKIKEAGLLFRLPQGSRLMFTGGPKGCGNLAGPDRLVELANEVFGIENHDVLQEFGMTELFSQSYDTGQQQFRSVPWLRSLVVDPVSMRIVKVGEQGLLLHIDLANCLSEPVILSSDIAIRAPGGFRPLRRVSNSTPRGCSQDGGE